MLRLKKTLNGIRAGILIAIGGSVFLSCDSRYIGSVLFSVALLCICYKEYALFTGKVGYLPCAHRKDDVETLLLCLLGNAIATVGCGYAVMYAIPKLKTVALTICEAKLTQSVGQTVVRSIFCGILMYLAVSIYREKKGIAAILFCVPVFILSGFEHSIANMFYFSLSGMVSVDAFIYLMTVVVGNSIGGVLLPIIGSIGTSKEKQGEQNV